LVFVEAIIAIGHAKAVSDAVSQHGGTLPGVCTAIVAIA
jgi:hypothetical protein